MFFLCSFVNTELVMRCESTVSPQMPSQGNLRKGQFQTSPVRFSPIHSISNVIQFEQVHSNPIIQFCVIQLNPVYYDADWPSSQHLFIHVMPVYVT